MTDDELSRALSALARGTVVAAATDTFYGFLADVRQIRALDALFEMKGRDRSKGVALLVRDKAHWQSLVSEISPAAERLADRFWPGPLTIAHPARSELDPRVTLDGTVAVRCPGPSDAARILGAFGAPVTATSANRAGAPPCTTSEEVEGAFQEAVASGELTIVRGTAPGGQPSTVLSVRDGQIRMVRRGRIPERDLIPSVPTSRLR